MAGVVCLHACQSVHDELETLQFCFDLLLIIICYLSMNTSCLRPLHGVVLYFHVIQVLKV